MQLRVSQGGGRLPAGIQGNGARGALAEPKKGPVRSIFRGFLIFGEDKGDLVFSLGLIL